MAKRTMVFWGKLVVFLCILAFAVNEIGALLNGGEDILRNASALRHLPKNSADVLWLGTSHMHYNIIPQYLYDHYGITSTMASGNSVDLSESYWELKEALRTQQPKVVVLDVYPAAAPYCYFYVQNVLAMRDRKGMAEGTNPYNTATGVARWLNIGSSYKPAAIAEAFAVSGADGDAYFDLTRFHTRYDQLSRSNFAYLAGEDRLTKNFGYLYGAGVLTEEKIAPRPYTLEAALAANEVGTFWEITDEQLGEVTLLDSVTEELMRIIRFAQEQGIELVLCAAPYLTNRAEESLFSQVGALAQREGVPFVGTEDVQLNELRYLRDMGHLNDEGARLYTAFWGEYFTDHFDLPDRRGSDDARYAPWRDNAGSYDIQHTAMQLIAYEGGLTEYLETISALGKDYLILINAEGEVSEGFSEDDYLLMMDKFGMSEEVLDEWYISSYGTLDAVICDGALLKSHYTYDSRTKELHWNVMGHDVIFEAGSEGERRWSVDGNSTGRTTEGMNIAVYSLIDGMLMENRTFNIVDPVFDE